MPTIRRPRPASKPPTELPRPPGPIKRALCEAIVAKDEQAVRKTNGAVDHLASAAANRQAVLDETSKSYALTGDPLMGLILWGPQDLPGVATALARAVPLGLQIKADELQADAHLALAASPEKLWK